MQIISFVFKKKANLHFVTVKGKKFFFISNKGGIGKRQNRDTVHPTSPFSTPENFTVNCIHLIICMKLALFQRNPRNRI